MMKLLFSVEERLLKRFCEVIYKLYRRFTNLKLFFYFFAAEWCAVKDHASQSDMQVFKEGSR